jgi:hypothetical protein
VIVRFTSGGRRQFLAAVRYIAEHDPSAAARFRLRAVSFPTIMTQPTGGFLTNMTQGS